MVKHKILADAKAEIERHVWGTFVEGNATVALSGTGVVVSGCEACRTRFGTNSQYLGHLSRVAGYLAEGFSGCGGVAKMTHGFQVGQRVAEKVFGRIGRVTKSGTIVEGDKPYVFYEVQWEGRRHIACSR
jgi:hypothetical protein